MPFAAEFSEFVSTHPAEKTGDGFRHSGSTRVHHGLSNPTMRGFVKAWAQAHTDLSYEDWLATMDGLYRGSSIDEACLAGFMLGHYQDYRSQLPLQTLDIWIGLLEGWREIDTTCQSNFSAKEMLDRWEQWQPFLTELANRPTIQHRRASLALLVKPIRQGPESCLIDQALSNISVLKEEKDKLITKAVSWVLRTAIKHYRDIVVEYVVENRTKLPSIALREFDKKLITGKK